MAFTEALLKGTYCIEPRDKKLGMQNKGCLMALFTVSAWRKHFVLLYLKKIEGLDIPFLFFICDA